MLAMFGLGLAELLILALVGLLMTIGAVVIVGIAVRMWRPPSRPLAQPPVWANVPNVASNQDLLRARYFRDSPTNSPRTCPRCHAALAPDAPEGLCPACLLAGGLEAESLPPITSGHGTPSGASVIDAVDLAAAFPHLEIVELLGQGGMGTVFKVRQKNLDRLAALKVIPPQAALDPTFAERFSREARALARLNHSSIVTVYDFGQNGGFYFLLMEYVDGPNLRQLMRTERIAPREALAIVPQICDALQYAHDQGIVHRDIKPENVLLDRTGRVKIADFGLAKLLGTSPADFTLTHTQQVMGTPRYMAPEQIERPLEVDHRADIYSLGVVIYEMLTGELPIGRFAPPSQKVQVDVRLDEIVLRTLEKEPARRYQQVSQVKTEIENVGTTPSARRGSPITPRPDDEATAIQHASSVAEPSSTPPLGIMLAIAIGMVVGMLMMAAGVVLALVGIVLPAVNDDMRYALLGSGIGVLLGGAGAFFGTYNSYRQLAGAVDLMRSPEVTWFDHVMKWFTVLGALLLVPGVLLLPTTERQAAQLFLTIGSVMAFQGLLIVLWRWGVRQQTATYGDRFSSTAPHGSPVGPGFWLGVAVPTLAIAAVWGLVLLDFHFMTSHWPQKSLHVLSAGPGGERRIFGVITDHRQAVIRGLWTDGTISVAVVFAGLALWRAVGPRRATPGRSRGLFVAPPFGHPVWPLAVVVVSFATFVFPWVRLQLDSVVHEPDFKVQLAPGLSYNGDTLRDIVGMPQGERYVATGVHHVGGAAAAILAGIGTLLGAGMMMPKPHVQRVQAGIGVATGVLAAMIVVAFAHQIGERDESLIIDAVTQRGLSRVVSGGDVGAGSGAALVLQDFISVSPALGLYLAAGMAGLLILISVTQWTWLIGAADLSDSAAVPKPLVADMPAKVLPDSGRQSARQQVRGPGMGLIVSGVLGIVPIVLLCVAIPLSWVVLVPTFTEQTRQNVIMKSGMSVVASPPIASIGIVQPPVILAQESPPPQLDAMPTWIGLFTMLILGLVFVVSLPASILLILGGMKMRQLQSYGLAYFAAIVALLPLGPQWLVSLPMGIWALAVLGRPEIKAAFQ